MLARRFSSQKAAPASRQTLNSVSLQRSRHALGALPIHSYSRFGEPQHQRQSSTQHSSTGGVPVWQQTGAEQQDAVFSAAGQLGAGAVRPRGGYLDDGCPDQPISGCTPPLRPDLTRHAPHPSRLHQASATACQALPHLQRGYASVTEVGARIRRHSVHVSRTVRSLIDRRGAHGAKGRPI